MIKHIVVDGNDGTGKSTRVNQLKQMFPEIEICDRGQFSSATLNEDIFSDPKSSKTMIARAQFYRLIKHADDTLFIILDADPEICQKRIMERGDSIDEPYHNMDDLKKYHNRFLDLVSICNTLPNVMLINTND